MTSTKRKSITPTPEENKRPQKRARVESKSDQKTRLLERLTELENAYDVILYADPKITLQPRHVQPYSDLLLTAIDQGIIDFYDAQDRLSSLANLASINDAFLFVSAIERMKNAPARLAFAQGLDKRIGEQSPLHNVLASNSLFDYKNLTNEIFKFMDQEVKHEYKGPEIPYRLGIDQKYANLSPIVVSIFKSMQKLAAKRNPSFLDSAKLRDDIKDINNRTAYLVMLNDAISVIEHFLKVKSSPPEFENFEQYYNATIARIKQVFST